MNIGPRLVPKLAPQMRLTPALRLALKLLQMPKLELEEAINLEIMENPVLEKYEPSEEEDSGFPERPGPVEEPHPEESIREGAGIQMDTYFEDPVENWGNAPAPSSLKDRNFNLENLGVGEYDLYHHLLRQLHLLNLTIEQRQLAEYIIGNLTPDGFLVATKEEIQDMGQTTSDSPKKEFDVDHRPAYTEENVTDVLGVVRGLDPIGIGFSTLRESLLWQLEVKGEQRDSLVCRIVDEKWEDFVHRRFEAIANYLKVPLPDQNLAVSKIIALEPRPGRHFNTECTRYIEPDVEVVKDGDD